MRLSHRRVQGRGFEHPLGDVELPGILDAVTLDTLVNRLRTGDLSVANEIIKGHMRLALSVVSRYYARYNCGRQLEDIVSVALLAVVESVRRATSNLQDNNITPYIVSAIHSRVSNYLTEDCVIHQPHGAEGKRPVVVEELPDVATVETSEIILWDLLSQACCNSVDREIVRLRSKGFGDKEVADAVGLSRPCVTKMRHAIETRFLTLYAA